MSKRTSNLILALALVGVLAALAALGLVAGALVFTYSRGGALAAGLVVALTLLDRRVGLRFVLPGAALAALLLALALLQAPHFGGSGNGRGWLALSVAGLVAAAAVTGFMCRRGRLGVVDLLAVIVVGAGSIAFAVWSPPDGFAVRVIGSALVLAGALWAVSLGQSGRQPAAKTTGLAVFGLEVIYLYTVTLGTMFDTALALLAGGALFIALSTALFRIDRRLAARATGASA